MQSLDRCFESHTSILLLYLIFPSNSGIVNAYHRWHKRKPHHKRCKMSYGSPRIKFALFGLGRLGVLRARILAFQQPRIELVAVCDTKPGTDKWAAENLPPSVQYFSDPQECLKKSGAEAVLICTATATHAPLILQALDLNLHVMCEKPVSVDIATTRAVVEKSASRPDLKFLVPFTRRCKWCLTRVFALLGSWLSLDDKSYRQAKALIDNGTLGEIHAVETTGIDQADPNGTIQEILVDGFYIPYKMID